MKTQAVLGKTTIWYTVMEYIFNHLYATPWSPQIPPSISKNTQSKKCCWRDITYIQWKGI